MPDHKRQELVYENNYRYINENTRHRAIFITKRGKNKNNYPIIEPHKDLERLAIRPNGRKDRNRDRGAKRVSACKYFYENTTFDYVWVGADDVYYDVDAIDPMIRELDMKYNTEYDVAMMGHNVDFGHTVFLQGGSGWILTRAGAKAAAEYGYKWVKNLPGCDDMWSTQFRPALKLNYSDMTCPYMYGHRFKQNVSFGFWRGNVPKCPIKPENTRMRPKHELPPLKKLVAYHFYPNKNNEVMRIMNNIIDAKKNDPTLYMYFGNCYMTICRKVS